MQEAKQMRKHYAEDVDLRTHEVRAGAGDGLVLEGYAAVYDTQTNIGGMFKETISRGAFDDVLTNDVRLLLNHDGAPMARTTNGSLVLSSDDHGLKYRANLVDTQASRDLHAMVKRGDISQSSFAFRVGEQDINERGDRNVLKVSELLDVSPVTYASYPTASVSARKRPVQSNQQKKPTVKMAQELTLKDLQATRQEYVDSREAVKDVAERNDRDLNDADVLEMRRLAGLVEGLDRQIEVKREDAAIAGRTIARSAAPKGEQFELGSLRNNFSIARGLQTIMRGKQLTGVEAEMTQEAVREANAMGIAMKGQLAIPQSALRAGSGGDWEAGSGDGNEFVGTQIGSAVRALVAPTVLERAGATVLTGLTGTLQIPQVSQASQIAVTAEAASAVTSDITLTKVTMTPRRLSAFTLVTEQLLIQGGNAVESLVTNDLATQLSQKVEDLSLNELAAAIVGTNFVETAISSDVLNTLIGSLIDGKVSLDNIAMIANGLAHGEMSQLAAVSAVNTLVTGNTVLGRPYYATGLLDDGAGLGGSVIVGDFSKFAIGYWGGIDLVINPYSLDLQNQIRISIHRHFDTAMLDTAGFRMRQDRTA
jgi:HK97 family phage prohead protease/HK97 family phage major capsid protein